LSSGITLPTRFAVECTTVTVPENHADPDGAQIELFVALVHSSSSDPLPDPVFFLPVGPGGAGSDVLFLADSAFASILATRDLIFFDQRGVGLSKPSLTCLQAAEPIWLAYLKYASGELNPAGVQDAVARAIAGCRDLFLSQGVDLAQYTTAQSAKNVPVNVKLLGYTQWQGF
jgi:pimeloyl-ACP methyl ester carboxylesterase